ncbi:hypothetical protein BGW38_010792, partial [Lunasporangiospora selenospora]
MENLLQGAGYFLDLANPEDLTPRAYAEYRHAEVPHIRNKEVVEEWQAWTKRLGDNPKWKDAFMRAEKLSLNSFRAWRKKAPQPESSMSTRSSSKRATTEQAFVSSSDSPSKNQSSKGPPGMSRRVIAEASATPQSSSSPSLPSIESSQKETDSISQSTGSSDSLSSEVVRQLGLEFSINFNDYLGTSWLLSSGTNVDETIRRYTMTQRAESSLHSFVVDDVDLFKSQFTADDFDLFFGQ